MSKKGKAGTGSVMMARPPVVTVVGHIDHGKTTLLDKIRSTRVASREAGGITQHIGASQIEFKTKEGKLKKLTFIDTPGHSAFAKMRARGVEVTDLVVLVIAADSGIQEQTKECLDHIKAAKAPFLVAINKIDLPTANVDQVKAELAEIGVVPEDYGGDIVTVPVSAKSGEGIDELLEMISLMADLQELKADPKGELEGVIIESTLDSRRGPIATVLVKNGTLKLGEEIFAETIRAKVKAMRNWLGGMVKEAFPGDPVEILGFESVPPVGAAVGRKPQERKAEKEKQEEREGVLKLLLKADVQGTLEAVLANLPAEVEVVHTGVGEVTDSDVFLAQTTGAKIFAFNVKVSLPAQRVASQNKIKIFQTKIIYELLEAVQKMLQEKADPFADKEILGRAEIIAEFKVGDKRVAGARVLEGEIRRGQKALLCRQEAIIGEAVTASMRQRQEDIEKAEEGMEFGIVFSPPLDFQPGDVIISYNLKDYSESDYGKRRTGEKG